MQKKGAQLKLVLSRHQTPPVKIEDSRPPCQRLISSAAPVALRKDSARPGTAASTPTTA